MWRADSTSYTRSGLTGSLRRGLPLAPGDDAFVSFVLVIWRSSLYRPNGQETFTGPRENARSPNMHGIETRAPSVSVLVLEYLPFANLRASLRLLGDYPLNAAVCTNVAASISDYTRIIILHELSCDRLTA